jgi:GTPase SAR1 family protein
MTTLLDHKTTLAYLAYLGYPDEPRTGALQVTRARKVDRRKGKVSRNVFLCYVCGAAGSGKTSLLRAFAGKPFSGVYEPTSKMISVVNSVDIDGSEKYLIVRVKFAFLKVLVLKKLFSYKSLGQDTKLRLCEIQKRQILRTLSFMSMIRATQIHFRTSAIFG